MTLFDATQSWEQVEEKYRLNPPLLAVEVLAPNDTMRKTIRRVDELLRFGTRLVWIVDPEGRRVIVYKPAQEVYVVRAGEELTDVALPDFRCRVAELFAMPGD